MPSISYEKYCKIAGVDASKSSKDDKHYKEFQGKSLSDLVGQYGSETLSHFTVAELKEELQSRSLDIKGVKADLISRLEESYRNDSQHKRKSPERDAPSEKHRKTTDSMDVDLAGKNPGNVAGGYKATLHNPNSSEEAKDHARKMLQEMGEDETPKADRDQEFDLKESLKGKNKGNVAGGYKAVLHNENASEEAKEKAKEVLSEMGVDPEEKADKKSYKEPEKEKGDDETVDEMDLIDPNNKRVIGGYKATLHNPNSSEEAKEHARSILKKLGVDPEAKEEAHSSGDLEGKNPGNVIGGYKAAAHNPNLSDEAREEAKKKLEEMGVDADEKADTKNHQAAEKAKDIDLSYKHKGNVIGGYRATLHNPNSSEETKEHARKMLKEMGVDPEGHADSTEHHQYASAEEAAQDALGKNPGNVIGGYRATLHNPNATEEAKEHAEMVLEQMGADPEGHAEQKRTLKHADTEGKNFNNVAGGYKATLKNPNASEEAKAHAQKELDRMGVDADEKADFQKSHGSEDLSNSHVIGGYKATLHNENSSEEAKEHARKMLKEAGVDEDEKADSRSADHAKNQNNVAGGYKATLSNPNASQEAKDHAKKMLDEMGVDADEKASQKTYHEADTHGKNKGNVIGGYKATLKNPNVSEEARENAEEQLEKLGATEEKSTEPSTEGKNLNNVIGGYKATLKNPNVSDEAKDHAKAALENLSN